MTDILRLVEGLGDSLNSKGHKKSEESISVFFCGKKFESNLHSLFSMQIADCVVGEWGAWSACASTCGYTSARALFQNKAQNWLTILTISIEFFKGTSLSF